MAYQPDFDQWQEPDKPPGGRRGWLWAGIALVVLFLACLCLVAGFVLVQQFQDRTEPAPVLVIPTAPGTAAAETAVAGPPIAPTVTLSPPATPPLVGGSVEAGQLSALPAIDGDLSEWSGLATYESTYRVYQASGWDGSDDLTAVWRLAWDVDNLYIGVEVTDDIHVQTQTGNQIFRGDSLDMQLDMNRAGDFSPRLSPDDFQITFSPGNFADLPPSAFRFRGTDDDQIRDAPGGHHIRVAAQKTDRGYNLEAAVPWGDLAVTPAPGLVMGLALNASDNDTVGTAGQEVMMSHVASRTLTDPTTWGTLRLR